MEFWLFGGLSLLAVIVTVLWVTCVYPRREQAWLSITPLNLLAAGVFVAAFLLFVPIYRNWDVWTDAYTYVRPVILSLIGAVQVFLLGIDFEIVEKTVPADPAVLKVLYSLYAAALYVAAPILTFGNVLSLFKNINGEFRLRLSRKRPVYIMSEMNEQSVAMAEQIVKAKKEKGGKPLIVFADVFAQNEESDYELLLRARKINAICLKKDAAHIDFGEKGEPVEIFLIGENEAENTEQAIQLTEKHKGKKRNIAVYVFAASPTTDYILDSVDKGEHYLHDDFMKWLKEKPQDILFGEEWKQKKIPMGGNFSVRRIDPVDLLVMDVLKKNEYADYKAIQAAAEQDKTIGITILGMGRYGTHFLKTAVWFYQRYGYRVEFNIFDAGGTNGDVRKRIGQECPELLTKNNAPEKDDAQYDIRFFTGIDCFSSDFDDLLHREAARFCRTKLVFVSLGDDDKDINAAMTVRALFDQMQIEAKGEATDVPFIYSVVYDDQKVSNLNAAPNGGLRNYREQKYQIRFVGARAEQYAYKLIEENKQRETDAFMYHLDWTRKESQLRRSYEIAMNHPDDPNWAACKEFKDQLDAELARSNKTEPYWGDGNYFKNGDRVDYSGKVNVDEVRKTAEKYMRYAYYRQSSLAKDCHKKALAVLAEPQKTPCAELCNCETCNQKRITEHMRWNAYTRSQGFRYGKKRSDRAKLHPDLRPWSDLSCCERYKD